MAIPTPSRGLRPAPGKPHVAACDPGPGLVPLTVRNLKHQAQRAREGACDPSTACHFSGRIMHSANQKNRTRTDTRQCDRGFTLVELMVVIAIVSIIAAIALPSYQQSVRKSRRADAVLALQQIQIGQERLRAECSSYAAGLAAARNCVPETPASNRLAFRNSLADGTGISDDRFYTVALSNVTPTGYTATATAVAGTSQASDTGCTPLVLAVDGLTLTRTPAECWTR